MRNSFLNVLPKERPHLLTPVCPFVIIDISKVIPIDWMHEFLPNNGLGSMVLKVTIHESISLWWEYYHKIVGYR